MHLFADQPRVPDHGWAVFGDFVAIVLALTARNLSFKVSKNVMRQTLKTAGYFVGIFFAAIFIALIPSLYGGDQIIENLVLGSFDNSFMVTESILFIIFVLGSLLERTESTLFIISPRLPVFLGLNIPIASYGVVDKPSVVWFAILVVITLQMSFLLSHVRLAPFYLKSVRLSGINLLHIYRDVIPFMRLQTVGLITVFFFPEKTTRLPTIAYGYQ